MTSTSTAAPSTRLHTDAEGTVIDSQGAGLYLEGEWAGGTPSTNGLSFYASVDVGGADLSVSGRGNVAEAMKRLPVGHWVRLAVAMRETASGSFISCRRIVRAEPATDA